MVFPMFFFRRTLIPIERHLEVQVPNSLKYLLAETGFITFGSLKYFDDESIADLQNFINRFAIHKNLQLKINCAFASIYEQMEEFVFLPGHKQMLKQISSFAINHTNGHDDDDPMDDPMETSGHALDLPMELPGQFSYLMRCLVNAGRMQDKASNPAGYRYSRNVKLFFTYLFLTAGKLSYDTMHANLPIPSYTSIQRYINEERYRVLEGKIHSDELLEYLNRMQCERKVWLSEDATGKIHIWYDTWIPTMIPTKDSYHDSYTNTSMNLCTIFTFFASYCA